MLILPRAPLLVEQVLHERKDPLENVLYCTAVPRGALRQRQRTERRKKEEVGARSLIVTLEASKSAFPIRDGPQMDTCLSLSPLHVSSSS